MVLLNKLIRPGGKKKPSPSTAMVSPASKPAKSVFSKGYFCLGLAVIIGFRHTRIRSLELALVGSIAS